MSTTAVSIDDNSSSFLLEARRNKASGDYGVTVSAPVCGTGCSGSIPGSRPLAKENTSLVEVFSFVNRD